MALKQNDLKILQDAIDNNLSISYYYFPNLLAKTYETNIRYSRPIRMFKRGGKFYVLMWFKYGASVSRKGQGYRLYLQKNLHQIDYEIKDTFSKVKIPSISKQTLNQLFNKIGD
jgi:hypothetical protein